MLHFAGRFTWVQRLDHMAKQHRLSRKSTPNNGRGEEADQGEGPLAQSPAHQTPQRARVRKMHLFRHGLLRLDAFHIAQ